MRRGVRESKRIPHFDLCEMCVGRMKCCAKDANLYSTLSCFWSSFMAHKFWKNK